MLKKSELNRREVLNIILCVFIFLYAFRKVAVGIDVTDGGYHFSNYRYIEQMDPMWFFSTYLSNILGHLFTLLPYGKTLLGINVYTSIIPAILGVVCYWFFVKQIKVSPVLVFVGEIIALSLCWCPTTGIYNYLTYLLFTVACILVYMGLTQERSPYLFGAGVVLGINVFVRFSNLVEVALILVVWVHLCLKKEGFHEIFRKTLYCFIGYLCGILLVLVPIMLLYGLDEYMLGISRLFSMTKVATAYAPLAMLLNMCHAYLGNMTWFANMLYFCILGVIIFAVAPQKYHRTKIVSFFIASVLFVRKLYGMSMFTLEFDDYISIYEWSIVMVFLAFVLVLWQLWSDKFSVKEKTFSMIILTIILINPLGSNNQFYTYINNMFLIAPYILGALHYILKEKKFYALCFEEKKYVVSSYPICILMVVGMVTYTVLSLGYGRYYSYRDRLENGVRDTTVENVECLKGMYTGATNARQLNDLAVYVKGADMEGKKALFFGVPGLSAYLEIPYLMTPWPDLESFSEEDFAMGIDSIKDNMESDRPVIMVTREFYDYLCEEVIDLVRYYEIKGMYGDKAEVLRTFIEEYRYSCTFANDKYAVLE